MVGRGNSNWKYLKTKNHLWKSSEIPGKLWNPKKSKQPSKYGEICRQITEIRISIIGNIKKTLGICGNPRKSCENLCKWANTRKYAARSLKSRFETLRTLQIHEHLRKPLEMQEKQETYGNPRKSANTGKSAARSLRSRFQLFRAPESSVVNFVAFGTTLKSGFRFLPTPESSVFCEASPLCWAHSCGQPFTSTPPSRHLWLQQSTSKFKPTENAQHLATNKKNSFRWHEKKSNRAIP